MSTLYRDYRPQDFSQVLGQNHLKISLQNELLNGQPAHAYLFCGPRAVGKTTLARILAKALNCEQRKSSEFEPCNKCSACQNITGGKDLDVMEIDAASNTGVDNVRENIIASARIAPRGKYKVFIIDEVHMLSISAFNALLKLLEEPPRAVVFVLCTTEVHKVPATIISRCERFDFKRISLADMVKKLNHISSQEKIDVDSGVLEAIARQAGGHMRDAESLLGQVLSLGGKKITAEQAELVIPNYNNQEIIDLLEHLSKKDGAKAIKLLNHLLDSGLNIKSFTTEVISLLRKLIFNRVNPGLAAGLGLDLGESLEARLNSLGENCELDEWLFMAKEFVAVYANNQNLFISQLPFELAILSICSHSHSAVSSGPSPEIRRFTNPSQPLNKEEKRPLAPPLTPNKTVVETETKASLAGRDANFNCDAQAVKDKWPEFLMRLKQDNHSLTFVLQNCHPGGVTAGCLSLTFKYKFHKDRVSDVNIKQVVEKTLAEVFGAPLEVQVLLDENLDLGFSQLEDTPSEAPLAPVAASQPIATTPAAPLLNNEKTDVLNSLLNVFGGEVIN